MQCLEQNNVEDLTTAHYEMKFHLAFLEAAGDAFQNLFSSVMELRYPGDFARVRPWGNIGDRKNDGYLRSQRKLFQCYAPRGMALARYLEKINEDFAGALPYWKQYFDQWIFTHNDTQGLAPDVLSLLLDLSAQNHPLAATHWGRTELLLEFKQLSLSDKGSLLGPAPGLRDVVDLRLEAVKNLLEHIALQPEPLALDIREVPADKLEHNQLSPAAATLLKAGMTRSQVVAKYLRGISDQTRYDRMASAFRLRYEKLKSDGLTPDDIFVGLQKFVAGEAVASPTHQAATLAILAFFFEACEIFERPNETPGVVQ